MDIFDVTIETDYVPAPGVEFGIQVTAFRAETFDQTAMLLDHEAVKGGYRGRLEVPVGSFESSKFKVQIYEADGNGKWIIPEVVSFELDALTQ